MALFEYPFQSHYLEISGTRMHYLDEGEGQPVVLLHGNPTWSYYYRNLIHVLARNFRVIAVDHIGCGFSDKPSDYTYTLAKHIENVTVLIDRLKLDSLSLVVHDWGGAIGFGYATRYIHKINSIVILNTAAFRSQRIPFRIRLCRWPVIGKLLVQGLNGFARPALHMAVTKKLSKDIADSYLLPYNSWKNRVALYRFVKDIPLDEKHTSYPTLYSIEKKLSDLEQKNTRIMVIWGGSDFCFNDHFYQQWQLIFPHAEYHYFEAFGHYVLEDGRGLVEPIIDTFLLNSP